VIRTLPLLCLIFFGIVFAVEDASAMDNPLIDEPHATILAAIQANDVTRMEVLIPAAEAAAMGEDSSSPVMSSKEVRDALSSQIAVLNTAAKAKGLLEKDTTIKLYGVYTYSGPWIDVNEGRKQYRFKPLMSQFDLTRGDSKLSVVYVLSYRPSKTIMASPLVENNISDDNWLFISKWRSLLGRDPVEDRMGCAIVESMASSDLADIALKSLRTTGPGQQELTTNDGSKLIVRKGKEGKLSCEVVSSKQ
jgi:hypothetical protein